MSRVAELQALAEAGRRLVATTPRPSAGARSWFRMASTGDRTAVYIYDEIGGFGVSADQFVTQLSQADGGPVDLHLNSPGGSVFDGIAIYSALVNHPGEVAVHVDSLAASAASFVAMAGNTIDIAKPAKMMIHDAQGVTVGNAADHTEMAAILTDISNTIAGIYADHTGTPTAEWRAAMQATTWYSAQQAVDAGLADSIAVPAGAQNVDRRTQLIRARARATLGRKR